MSAAATADGDGLDDAGDSDIADPTCALGIVSLDGTVCSPQQCGLSDGTKNCALRPGGEACCTHRVRLTALSCNIVAAPCLLDPSQSSKRLAHCTAQSAQGGLSFELGQAQLEEYSSSDLTDEDKNALPYALEGGARYVVGDRADIVDLSSPTASILLRQSFQPSAATGQGFSICMWFKPTADTFPDSLFIGETVGEELALPLASKWIEDKGWELRVTSAGRVSFHVGNANGEPFKAATTIVAAQFKDPVNDEYF